jgi:hypothetical protein
MLHLVYVTHFNYLLPYPGVGAALFIKAKLLLFYPIIRNRNSLTSFGICKSSKNLFFFSAGIVVRIIENDKVKGYEKICGGWRQE